MPYAYDGFDLSDLVVYFIQEASLGGAPRESVGADYRLRAGGLTTGMTIQRKALGGTGAIGGATVAQLETRHAALKRAVHPPARRLLWGNQSDRFYVARLAVPVEVTQEPGVGMWTATLGFVADDPYAQALAHSAGLLTPTLTLLTGET